MGRAYEVRKASIQKTGAARGKIYSMYAKEIYQAAKNGGVAVIHADCPHQDCVHMGYVYETNHPIICAHNGVYIIIVGEVYNDTEAG